MRPPGSKSVATSSESWTSAGIDCQSTAFLSSGLPTARCAKVSQGVAIEMSTGKIQWPADQVSAHRLFVGYLVEVVDRTRVIFDSSLPDPVLVARDYLAGRISDDDLRALARPWWRSFYPEDSMQDRTAAMGRLAVSLIGMSDRPAENFDDLLDWALQFMYFLGYDARPAIGILDGYFAFVD